jgi:phthalate 4,5-cis-dihydrodiol dehydrogenase
MTNRQIQIGVVGLGRAFTLMLPTFLLDSRVKLAGAADPLSSARAHFEKDFGKPASESLEALCANPAVQAIYVASPHQFHAEHVCMAVAYGKHVLVEKPMALTLAECSRMIEAARSAGVHLLVGHSHSFNAPVQRARQIIDSDVYGAVKMITALNFTDFLYRPRRPEELDTRAGGGVIHSQAAHQIDVVRMLGGGLVSSVRAHMGAWDLTRPTEGAYSALLGFENGAFASATYSGYGHFDTDDWMGGIGEMGRAKNPADYGAGRRRLQGAGTTAKETALKAARNYGGSLYAPDASAAALAHQHFGPVIVSCEKADLRLTATGIAIDTDTERLFEPLPAPAIPRREVIDELFSAVMNDVPPIHSGEWARATTAVCLAMLESARTGRDCQPTHQVVYRPHA